MTDLPTALIFDVDGTLAVATTTHPADEDFPDAALVVTHLGERDDPAEIIRNPHGIPINGVVDLDVLAQLAQVRY